MADVVKDAKKVLKELLFTLTLEHPAVQAQERVIKHLIKEREKNAL